MRTEEELKAINAQLRVIEIFKDLTPNITMGEICFFIKTATTQGLCMSELGKYFGFKTTTTSRYFKNLSERKSATEVGLGLLHSYRDPENNRRRLVVLTPKGREFYKQILREKALESQRASVPIMQGSDNNFQVKTTWGNFKVRSDRHPC